MEQKKVALDMLFETSWEVCNKIGGIYTVLSTKAKTLTELYPKDRVVFVGPDVWDDAHPSPDFRPVESLFKDWRRQANLPAGVTVRVGRWMIPGRPVAVLVKFNGLYASRNTAYSKMWELYGVDSLHAYGDYDEGCAFARAAAMVIKSIADFYVRDSRRVIAHFDEWTTAMGLLWLKWKAPHIATVFTTHATCIGRSICGNGKPLYDYLKGYNGDQMARELNMEAKHSLEKAAAREADCFTTVSEVTALECEQLLERRPDVVTPNGFEADFVPTKTRYTTRRRQARNRLLETATALTGKRYSDTDTMIVVTSGRCEYRNKGIDIFLDSLNALAKKKPRRKILAFIMIPSWADGPRNDLASRLTQKTRTPLLDPVTTHRLHQPSTDPIYNRIHSLGFDNSGHTRVDVIYVPCYLNGNDGIFNTPYYDLLIGVDATTFPSYYEPWGYTPLESVAFGVPTVTTSLSGFGQWVLRNFDNLFDACGVNVIGRTDSSYHETVEQIAEALRYLAATGPTQQGIIADAARRTAAAAAWSYFVTYYVDAFEIALSNASKR